MTFLADHILSVLSNGAEMTAREIWLRLDRRGAESSLKCRLCDLEKDGRVIARREGESVGSKLPPTVWKATA